MLPALPGSRGSFILLQHALATASANRVRVTQVVKDFILDFQHLGASLTVRPTRLRELVPTTPSYVGASDACAAGMGTTSWQNPLKK